MFCWVLLFNWVFMKTPPNIDLRLVQAPTVAVGFLKSWTPCQGHCIILCPPTTTCELCPMDTYSNIEALSLESISFSGKHWLIYIPLSIFFLIEVQLQHFRYKAKWFSYIHIHIYAYMSVKVLVIQLYPILCDPMDCSLPGSFTLWATRKVPMYVFWKCISIYSFSNSFPL